MSEPKLWRVGQKIKLNVYDEHGNPVCQCHNPNIAEIIVEAVNQWMERKGKVCSQREPLLDGRRAKDINLHPEAKRVKNFYGPNFETWQCPLCTRVWGVEKS